MAGHSQFKNIMYRKGAQDAKRSKLFSKLAREIQVAARTGMPDPELNPRLRAAIMAARAANMPKDNIERAIQKGCGDAGAAIFTEIVYEGYGVAGVAVLCVALTDNRNRTAGEVRKIFEVAGGNLGSTGCVSWMFDRKGLFTVDKTSVEEETLFELALESGADDVEDEGEVFQITSSVESFQGILEALQEAEIETEISEITHIPQNTVDLDASNGKKVLNLLEALEDQDDVQSVTANFNIPDEILAEVAG